ANAPTADECGPPPSRSQSRPVPGPAQKPKAKGCSHRPARCRLGGGSLASASHNDLQDLSYLCNAIDIRKCQEPRRNFPDGSLGACPRIRRGRVSSAAGQMQGGATQAMSMYIVEERQRRRCPAAIETLWAHGDCGRSLRCSLSTMCIDIASSSRLELASQAPCARPLLILGQAPRTLARGAVIWRLKSLC